jgi:predicted NBD/HSP70 family sugar kinase
MVADRKIIGLGVSMFGLIDLREKQLLEVPRHDWRAAQPSLLPFDFKTVFEGFPVYVGHDSSTSAVGEWCEMKRRYGRGFEPAAFVRIRIGAGVGVGCVNQNGTVRAGRSHPEAGHLPVIRRESDRRGTCRAHSKEQRDCIEGLLSEKAILARCGAQWLSKIPSNHMVWGTAAEYLAQLCVAITTLIAPDMIVIGGRTMIDGRHRFREPVLRKIQDAFQQMIGEEMIDGRMVGGYPRYEQTMDVNQYICPSVAVPNPASASLLGVAELARREFFRVIKGGREVVSAAPDVRGG